MESRPGPPDYDQTLKGLLLRGHDGFLALIAPELKWRREVSPELPAIARQADLVWEVEGDDGQTGLLHIELQTKPEADIGERMAEYALRIWRREHQPVRSLVVFLRPAPTVPASPFVIQWMGHERLRFTFDVIRLWELPPERVLETQYYDLWPVAGLMAGVTPDSTAAIADKIATAPIPASDRNDLTRLLLLLAGMRVPRDAIIEAIRRKAMTLDLWNESSLKDALAYLYAERAMARVIEGVLESRFGPLPADLMDELSRADTPKLEALVPYIGTETLEQIRARLGLS